MKMSYLWRNLVLFALMLAASGLTLALYPVQLIANFKSPVDLEVMIPRQFADWREAPAAAARIVDPQEIEVLNEAYSQVLSRSYVNGRGDRIMLSIAYGATQRGSLQLHHPELCYPGQGFEIRSNQTAQLVTVDGLLPIRRLETRLNKERIEPVTYWAIVGEHVVLNSFDRKLAEMRYGLQGKIADGLLFRVSSIDRDSAAAFTLQARFITELLAAVPAADRIRLSGI
jgi:EpsI family protein